MEVIEVIWIDSGAYIDPGEWSSTAVYQQRAKQWNGEVKTIGQLVYEDSKVLVLALNVDLSTGNAYGAQLIYKPCIKTRRIIT